MCGPAGTNTANSLKLQWWHQQAVFNIKAPESVTGSCREVCQAYCISVETSGSWRLGSLQVNEFISCWCTAEVTQFCVKGAAGGHSERHNDRLTQSKDGGEQSLLSMASVRGGVCLVCTFSVCLWCHWMAFTSLSLKIRHMWIFSHWFPCPIIF